MALQNTLNYEKQGGAALVIGGTITEENSGQIKAKCTLNVQSADIGTSGSVYVVTPFAGKVTGLTAVNSVANAGTKTVLLGKLGGTNITAPAWEVAVTAVAGTAIGVTPTATNTVAAGDVIEINFDGGSSNVTPACFTITITRT
jgi:hypothetical protein